MPSVKGTALVTGAADRIGAAITRYLAQEGFDIALHCHKSRQKAELLAEEIRDLRVRCEVFSGDLTHRQERAALIPAVRLLFPDLRILIHNASIFQNISFLETDEETYRQNMAIHVEAPFFLSQYFSRSCNKGLIITLLDTRISRINKDYFIYSLTKTCLANFTRSAAKSLGPDIRVNGICPGLILPPPGKGSDYLATKGNKLPLRTHGHPQNILSALDYIMKNDFVTGECLYVDGGESLG